MGKQKDKSTQMCKSLIQEIRKIQETYASDSNTSDKTDSAFCWGAIVMGERIIGVLNEKMQKK